MYECIFSDLKRLFDDILQARTRWNDVAETFQKARLLNIARVTGNRFRRDRITEYSLIIVIYQISLIRLWPSQVK